MQFGTLGLVRENAGHGPGMRRHIPPVIFLTGLTILLISLARPQASVSLPRIEGTVILAFDMSASMAADDLKPTRMDAAKSAALAFVQRQPSNIQIGVVAFSDSGFTVQAPSDDREAIVASINRLTPERGTSLANGILASLNIIEGGLGEATKSDSSLTETPTPTPVPEGTYSSSVIILLTDGENTEPPDPLDAAKTAKNRGVRVHTIGIGSAAGAILNIDGFNVFTQLDELALQQISQITDGVYFNAENEENLAEIYDQIDLQLVTKSEKIEVTSILAGLSILIFLIGGAFSIYWFSRLP